MNLWQHLESLTAQTAPEKRTQALVYHGARVGIAVALAVVTYLFFPAAPAVDVPLYEVGSVANQNVIAPFAFQVPKDSAQLAREREEIARAAEPVFVYRQAALDSARRRVRLFFAGVVDASDEETVAQRAAGIRSFASAAGIELTPEEAVYLANPARREAFESAITQVVNQWLVQGVVSSGALEGARGVVVLRRGDEERRVQRDSLLTFTDLLARARRVHPAPQSSVGDALYIKLVTSFFHPSIALDVVATERAREELRRSIVPYRYEVRSAEKIVGANEVVGREEHEKLRALINELQTRRAGQDVVKRVVGAVLFNFLVIALFGIALLLYRPQVYGSLRNLAVLAGVFLIVLGGAALIAHGPVSHPELVPIAFAALMISVIFDPRISVIAAMVLAVLIGGQSVFRGTNALFINLIGGVAAAFSVRTLRRRNQTYYSFAMIAGAYLLAAIAIGLALGSPSGEIMQSAWWGAVNALVSAIFAMALLPIAEELTGIDTDLKLLEWSDLNRPLMRRLSLEAPGTYAHTMAIANFAEAAANAISANGLLARVGAYYHDIGKLKKPQYFVENQPKGRNPHDKLKPSTSAAIIKNHVREGLELAEEYRIPKAVRAFITEHHGTGQISYFLEKARERDGGVEKPGEFAYPGPLPQSAETAIVMLADGVEAAARVLADPTPQKIREVVDHIVKQRVEQGQLRDAPLTLKQLDIIKEQFARVLIGMHHNRIDYPASGGGVTAEFAST